MDSCTLFILRDISKERRLAAILDRATNDLITNGPEMIDIQRRIHKVAPKRDAILLQGESGTGQPHNSRRITGDKSLDPVASHTPSGH